MTPCQIHAAGLALGIVKIVEGVAGVTDTRIHVTGHTVGSRRDTLLALECRRQVVGVVPAQAAFQAIRAFNTVGDIGTRKAHMVLQVV